MMARVKTTCLAHSLPSVATTSQSPPRFLCVFLHPLLSAPQAYRVELFVNILWSSEMIIITSLHYCHGQESVSCNMCHMTCDTCHDSDMLDCFCHVSYHMCHILYATHVLWHMTNIIYMMFDIHNAWPVSQPWSVKWRVSHMASVMTAIALKIV